MRRSYQPTYEELKREIGPLDMEIVKRYQPTYEELKQLKTARGRQSDYRYQPTYEELKPILLLPICPQLLHVTSLPMRN